MYKYFFKKEVLHNESVGDYISYGIGVYIEDNKIKHHIEYISDVFTDEKTAHNFVEKCNRFDLNPTHLSNVIEDVLIGDKYIM